MKKFYIYTDGSCPKSGFAGGWAYIIETEDGEKIIGSGGAVNTTNNKMEMAGPIAALKTLPEGSEVVLTSDSQYVTKGISEWLTNWKRAGWRKKNYETKQYEPILNLELWQELDGLLKKHTVKTNWVRGHAGHPQNEQCDEMAGLETKKYANSPRQEQ